MTYSPEEYRIIYSAANYFEHADDYLSTDDGKKKLSKQMSKVFNDLDELTKSKGEKGAQKAQQIAQTLLRYMQYSRNPEKLVRLRDTLGSDELNKLIALSGINLPPRAPKIESKEHTDKPITTSKTITASPAGDQGASKIAKAIQPILETPPETPSESTSETQPLLSKLANVVKWIKNMTGQG